MKNTITLTLDRDAAIEILDALDMLTALARRNDMTRNASTLDRLWIRIENELEKTESAAPVDARHGASAVLADEYDELILEEDREAIERAYFPIDRDEEV